MVWYDPFHREGDAMGLALAHTRMGRAYRDATGCAAGETTVELTYHARITGNTSVHASIQYLLDPVFAESGGGTGRALLAGLRTEITF